MVDLKSEIKNDFDDFEKKLAENTKIKILTKKKLVTGKVNKLSICIFGPNKNTLLTEQPLLGKSGYILTANDETIAVLVSSIGEVPCCGRGQIQKIILLSYIKC
jgi:hypothetical protein